jgi:exonuclease VII large subunit
MSAATNLKENAEQTLKLVWGQAKGQMNDRLQTVEAKTREIATMIETNGKKQVEQLRSQLQVEDILTKSGLQNTLNQGISLGQGSLEKLGLQADLSQVSEIINKVKGHAETVLQRSENPLELELEQALAKIESLETELKALKAKAVVKSNVKPSRNNSTPKAKKSVTSAKGKTPVAKKAAPKATGKKPTPKKAAPKAKKSSAKTTKA